MEDSNFESIEDVAAKYGLLRSAVIAAAMSHKVPILVWLEAVSVEWTYSPRSPPISKRSEPWSVELGDGPLTDLEIMEYTAPGTWARRRLRLARFVPEIFVWPWRRRHEGNAAMGRMRQAIWAERRSGLETFTGRARVVAESLDLDEHPRALVLRVLRWPPQATDKSFGLLLHPDGTIATEVPSSAFHLPVSSVATLAKKENWVDTSLSSELLGNFVEARNSKLDGACDASSKEDDRSDSDEGPPNMGREGRTSVARLEALAEIMKTRELLLTASLASAARAAKAPLMRPNGVPRYRDITMAALDFMPKGYAGPRLPQPKRGPQSRDEKDVQCKLKRTTNRLRDAYDATCAPDAATISLQVATFAGLVHILGRPEDSFNGIRVPTANQMAEMVHGRIARLRKLNEAIPSFEVEEFCALFCEADTLHRQSCKESP